jgi:hypothetical protein
MACYECQNSAGGPDSRLLAGPFIGMYGASVYRCVQCGTEWNREHPAGAGSVGWGARRQYGAPRYDLQAPHEPGAEPPFV